MKVSPFTIMKCIVLFPILLFAQFLQSASILSPSSHFTVLTYNCENAFDTLDAPDFQDEDFLPQGRLHWSHFRFVQKMQRIAQVFLAADTLKPLDIGILQEIESDSCLIYLTQETPIASIGYQYLKTTSRDARGINVAIVYRPNSFQYISHESIGLSDSILTAHHWTPTRDILHAWGRIPSGDTLHVFAVHLPSRLGRVEAQQKRNYLLALLAQQINHVQHLFPRAHILLAGDFNSAPSSSDILQFAKQCTALNNLVENKALGSYKYQGIWEWIDQIWVSQTLAELSTSVHTLTSPFLLESDPVFGGTRPFRTFIGPSYHAGYSDHLPVVYRFPL